MKIPLDVLERDRVTLEKLAGKTFLITGGDGMLGRAFATQLQHLVPSAVIHRLNKTQLDVRRPEAFLPYVEVKADFVIHCAALVDADYCEDHLDEARLSIVGGTRNVVKFARDCGAKLFYPQSFLIYDGVDPVIDEETPPRPLGVYGALKLEAENLVLEESQQALSVRMGGFFGGESADNNFVGRITPHLAKLIRQRVPSIEIGNRIWQPTYTNDLAANSLLLLAANRAGIYCMASHGSASFHELTVAIAAQIGVEAAIDIRCIDAAILANKERARRPRCAIMLNRRLQVENLDRQGQWRQRLGEYLDRPFFKDMFQ